MFVDHTGTTAYVFPIPYDPPSITATIAVGSAFAPAALAKATPILAFLVTLLWPIPTASDDTLTLDALVANTADYADLVGSLNRAKEKSKTVAIRPRTPKNEHHIVPRVAKGAASARGILEGLGISVVNDPDNKVLVSTTMHWFMHTGIYVTAVNGLVELAYEYSSENKEYNVRWMLRTIKALIQAIDGGDSLLLE